MSGDINSENPEPVVKNELTILPVNTREFEANGKKYYVEDDLSITRYKAFQRYELELGISLNFEQLVNQLHDCFRLLNEQEWAQTAVLIYKLIEGTVPLGEKKPYALYVAALFINSADEKRDEWNETQAKEKLDDWKDIGVNFFLGLALSKCRGFKENILKTSQMLEELTVGKISLEKMERTEHLNDFLSSTGN